MGFSIDFSKIKAIFKKDFVNKKPPKRALRIVISLLITAAVAAVYYYWKYPCLNVQSQSFWYFLILIAVVFGIVTFAVNGLFSRRSGKPKYKKYAAKTTVMVSGTVAVVCALVLVVGAIVSSVFFSPKKYAKLINLDTEGNFAQEVDEIGFDEIPLLDTDSAIKLGDAKLGELSEMVSQYEVDSAYYTQINYKGAPYRVCDLRYGDFFKWWRNTKDGIPAYVSVNMNTQEANVIMLSNIGNGDGMHYSESEWFNHKLSRYVQMRYPTAMIYEYNFEVDENGVPYWIIPCESKTIGLFGGETISSVIILNAVTGESKMVDIEEVATKKEYNWIDRANSSSLVVEQYNYYGKYRNGFWNSIFGQKGVTVATTGYNYIAQNDDVYMYTGVTSVTNDASNIGFLLSNQRTKQSTFYKVSGATESVAQNSANGQAQNYEYNATFPILLNVGGQPTYLMAMKDSSDLVKGYAMVNVKQYQVVSFANDTDPLVCRDKYISLLLSKKIITDESEVETQNNGITGKIADIRTADISGNTIYYIKLAGSASYYSISAADNQNAVLLNKGDTVTISYKAENQGKTIVPIGELVSAQSKK